MRPPRVSVVIPTYNHARFLGPALESLRAQSMPDWEAIIVNNFSSDDTEQVVAALADPRIRIVNFANHGVIAASRNRGIALARSELVAFLDSDDLWRPHKLEACLQRLSEGYDLVCHGERWFWEDGSGRDVMYGPAQRATFEALLFEGNCISTSAVVVRRNWLERVNGFDESEDLITAEDYHLWLRLAQNGARIGFIDAILGDYRIHAGSQSRAVLRNVQATRMAFEKVFASLPPASRGSALQLRRRLAILDYSGARGLQQSGEHINALRWFLKALLRWPFSPKFYVACLLNALHVRMVR